MRVVTCISTESSPLGTGPMLNGRPLLDTPNARYHHSIVKGPEPMGKAPSGTVATEPVNWRLLERSKGSSGLHLVHMGDAATDLPLESKKASELLAALRRKAVLPEMLWAENGCSGGRKGDDVYNAEPMTTPKNLICDRTTLYV